MCRRLQLFLFTLISSSIIYRFDSFLLLHPATDLTFLRADDDDDDDTISIIVVTVIHRIWCILMRREMERHYATNSIRFATDLIVYLAARCVHGLTHTLFLFLSIIIIADSSTLLLSHVQPYTTTIPYMIIEDDDEHDVQS